MNYTQATGEKSTVKLTITFTEEEWKDAISKAYLKTRGKYTVPGFRKGKAPKPVLENYYGKAVFYEEALNSLYSEHYFSILEKGREGRCFNRSRARKARSYNRKIYRFKNSKV